MSLKFSLYNRQYCATYKGHVVKYVTLQGEGTLHIPELNYVYKGEFKHDKILG